MALHCTSVSAWSVCLTLVLTRSKALFLSRPWDTVSGSNFEGWHFETCRKAILLLVRPLDAAYLSFGLFWELLL